MCKSQLVILRHIFSKYSPRKIFLTNNCDWHVVPTDGCYFSKIVLASAVGERLMNTIGQHFTLNFVQKKKFLEKWYFIYSKYEKKDGPIFFPFFLLYFLFSIFYLKLKTNMLKFICTSAKWKKKKNPQKGDFFPRNKVHIIFIWIKNLLYICSSELSSVLSIY